MRLYARDWAAAMCCAAVILTGSAACDDSADDPLGNPDETPSPSPSMKDGGGRASDAGGGAQPIATATALLMPTSADRTTPAQGMATFRTTTSGVDLEITLNGLGGKLPYPVAIVDAPDCSEASLQAMTWERSEGIPGIAGVGTSMIGRLAYARLLHKDAPWTIGGRAAANVVGRILIVSDPSSLAAITCGAIIRGDDAERIAPPAPDQPPRAEVRAVIAGLCFAKMFAGSSQLDCPDPEALSSCVGEHCELGECLQQCAQYTACLEQSEQAVCASSTACPMSPECGQCQTKLWSCTSSFCGQELSCAPPITPDGPCAKLEACCALQGDRAANCLVAIHLVESFSGDVSCVGGMHDWDVLSHMHVPCKFEE